MASVNPVDRPDTAASSFQQYLAFSIDHAAMAGQMTFHTEQIQYRLNNQQRLAHAQAADQLYTEFEASLNLLRDLRPQQPSPYHHEAVAIVTQQGNATTGATTGGGMSALGGAHN